MKNWKFFISTLLIVYPAFLAAAVYQQAAPTSAQIDQLIDGHWDHQDQLKKIEYARNFSYHEKQAMKQLSESEFGYKLSGMGIPSMRTFFDQYRDRIEARKPSAGGASHCKSGAHKLVK